MILLIRLLQFKRVAAFYGKTPRPARAWRLDPPAAPGAEPERVVGCPPWRALAVIRVNGLIIHAIDGEQLGSVAA
jgi:hypothetical protein